MAVPVQWRAEVERVLITDAQIARRVQALAREIQKDFSGRELVVVSLLTGTVMFLADLIRNLSLPLRLDFMGVSSYGAGTESGDLVFTKELRLGVRGRDVLLVDDILDTGKTMTRVLGKLHALRPRRIRTCVLLNKAARRIEPVEADYVGFEIPRFFCHRLRPQFRGTLPQPALRRRAASPRIQALLGKQCCQLEGMIPTTRFPPMRLTVSFYAYFKELTGCAQATEVLPSGATIQDLLARLATRFPKLAAMEKSTFVAVGVDYQGRSYVLHEGDEVSLFPPVQGG